jgi:signal transduction histidine kinase
MLLESVESLRPLALAKRQKLTASVECNELVMADTLRLPQVFHNLIDNAVKYTPAEGSIVVTLTRRNSEAVITVQDNGIGIPPEDLPQIFDRFFRVHQGSASPDIGAGLGLSIVASIVSAHGGRVDAESTPGAGSAFRVYLPIKANSASKPG